MSETKINRFLEILRWCGVAVGIFLAFLLGTGPVQQFNIFAIISVIFVAGLTAVEGLFFGKSAAEVSGYGEGGVGYRRQSQMHFIALFLAIIISAIFSWGFFSYFGIYLVFILFLTLSAINHFYTGIKEKFVVNTLLRPLLVVLIWVITLYFLLPAFKMV
jgi:hypothetical protein